MSLLPYEVKVREANHLGKVVIGVAAGVSLVAFLVAAAANSLKAEDPRTIPSTINTALAKDRFANGEISDYIVQTFEPNNIVLKRGESTTVMMKLEHKTNGNGQDVVLTNFHNDVRNFGPSAREGISDEEFEDLITDSPATLVRGEVSMQGMAYVSSPELKLAPDSVKTIEMTISLPSYIADEMVGKSIYVNANFDIIPEDPSVVASQDTLVIEVAS
jgi:hypothetical protein